MSKKSFWTERREEDQEVVVDDGRLLDMMATEVEWVNKDKGWYDEDPRVDRFRDLVEEAFEGVGMDERTVVSIQAVVSIAAEVFGPRTVGDEIALLHSEVSEALEEYRDHGSEWRGHEFKFSDGSTVRLEEGSPDRAEYIKQGHGPGKPVGFASELADVLVRLLDTAKRTNIDLFEAWRDKVDYNRTRPRRHGGRNL